MKTEKLLTTIGALCLMGSLANGADLSQRGPISFDIYDTNNDGLVSKSEFYDARAKRQSIRANQGMPMRKAGNAPDFELFDTNKDGKLTKLELLEGQNSQMQKNRSNKGNMNKGQRGNRQGMGQGRSNNQTNSARGMRRNMPTFESYDLNSDGYLTESEMNEARNNRMSQNAQQGKMMRNAGNNTPFSDIDTDNDGKVSKNEFLANQSRRN
ncbi:MAG: EF-hand domain-containing protein [Arcobacteraceae bacterium]|nr:EF-hand domain-containing protein [Arcobacteraceae bacterium]